MNDNIVGFIEIPTGTGNPSLENNWLLVQQALTSLVNLKDKLGLDTAPKDNKSIVQRLAELSAEISLLWASINNLDTRVSILESQLPSATGDSLASLGFFYNHQPETIITNIDGKTLRDSIFTHENKSRTINIPNTFTADDINLTIAGIGKCLTEGTTITLQFEDSPTKIIIDDYYENPSQTNINVPNHGLLTGDSFSIEGTLSYDGDYVVDYYTTDWIGINVIHDDNQIFDGNQIIRIPQIIMAEIFISGFFSGGCLELVGNDSDSLNNPAKKVFLDFNFSSNNAFSIITNSTVIKVKHMKIKFNSSSNYRGISCIDNPTKLGFYGVSILGNSTVDGECFFINGGMATIAKCFVSNAIYGIRAQASPMTYSNNNGSFGENPSYALYSLSSIINKSGTQPTGAIADELTSSGGVIR